MLIVDDDKIVRMTSLKLMHKLVPEWTFVEARSGEQALKLLEQARTQKELFDLVLTDHFMPMGGGSQTGAETIRNARQKGYQDLIIIGMSGNDLEALHRASGADHFWTKPFPKRSVLKDDLVRLMARRQWENLH